MTRVRTLLPCAAPPARLKLCAAFLFGLSLALGAAPASAEEQSVEEMICALNPKCAKPFVDQAGSGTHIHVSVLDQDGKNIFACTPHSG